jgi:uncharacterized protein (TIGR00661 family)
MTKRVLVAPLDWGLGHATRCIPIINCLLEYHCEVMVASSGAALTLLKMEFPALSFFELPAYDPIYSSKNSMIMRTIRQLPKFYKVINNEHRALQRIVRHQKIDILISDNRYGCWSNDVKKSIFITHQLNILMPSGFQWLAPIVNYFNQKSIKKFDCCWVPDHEGVRALTGKLSRHPNLTPRYIGVLSRFGKCLPEQDFRYKLLVILSGPEPQRTILEGILVKQIGDSKLPALLVRGVPGDERVKINDQFEIINFLNSRQLNEAICLSEIIIARSGYSTIMDLATLEKKAILIPTPGQTEQEYLAITLQEKGIALSAPQLNFNLIDALTLVKTFTGFSKSTGSEPLLKKTIGELIK